MPRSRAVGANLIFDEFDGYSYAQDPDYTTTTWVLGIVGPHVEMQIHPTLSKKVIDNYNIQTPKWPGYIQQTPGSFAVGPDGHHVTKYLQQNRTAPTYWQNNCAVDTAVFMPVDNMAFSNWNHWLNVRKEHKQTPYTAKNLIGLGFAIHALQDATAAPHLMGSLAGMNHEEYENHIGKYFDTPTMTRDGGYAHAYLLIMNWQDPKTIEDIKQILAEDIQSVISAGWAQYPDVAIRQDIPVRNIIRRLAEKTMAWHSILPAVPPWHSGSSGISQSIHARGAIKYAVAGTVALLIHGAKGTRVPTSTCHESWDRNRSECDLESPGKVSFQRLMT